MKDVKFPLVGERFKTAIREAHLTQQELADKTNINKSSISQYCNGTNCPARDRAEIIGRVLDVNPAWLMGFEAEKDNDAIRLMEAFKALPKEDQDYFIRLMTYARKLKDKED